MLGMPITRIEKALVRIKKTNPPQSVLLILFCISAKEWCGEINFGSEFQGYLLGNLDNPSSIGDDL